MDYILDERYLNSINSDGPQYGLPFVWTGLIMVGYNAYITCDNNNI